MDNIKLIYEITKELSDANIPDSYPTAKEIVQYTQDIDEINSIISRLKNDEPWEYIRGYTYFKGYKFNVNSSTLIPRIETEKLVDLILERIDKDTKQIIEVGSGTGSIIISVAKELEKRNINIALYAIEYYDKAIELLNANIEFNNVKNIKVIKSNLLSNITKIDKTLKTIIVANLPYISESEYVELQPSVRLYEPKSALVGGMEGSELILDMIEQAKDINTQSIVLESSQSINSYITNKYPKTKIVKDIFDKDRFLVIE